MELKFFGVMTELGKNQQSVAKEETVSLDHKIQGNGDVKKSIQKWRCEEVISKRSKNFQFMKILFSRVLRMMLMVQMMRILRVLRMVTFLKLSQIQVFKNWSLEKFQKLAM